jgi:alpha-glucosidase
MLIEEPYVASHLEEHDALTTRGFLAKDCASCSPTFIDYDPWWGRGGIVDYTNPDASQFWHQFRRQDLYRLGISSHWLDLGEPEQYNPWAWYYGFPERGAHGHGDIHNIYNLRWVQGIYDSYVNLENSERPFLLSRSGTAGIQRYGTSLWSGDIGTNWGNLRAQHQVQMQMALSGIDYYGSDVGGFQRANHNVPGGVHQLYSVWYANSALFDIPLRPHAWNLDKNLSTSPSSKGHLPSNLTNTVLRYHLSPYYYSLAHKAHKQGEAIVAPAVYHFQNDLDLRLSGTMKTIGPFLLAKALADPHLIGSDVYLPKGIWYDFHRHFQIQSRGELVRNLPLYLRDSLTIPLFVKEGAILPVMTVDSTTKNLGGRKSSTPQNQPLEIKIYPSSEGSNFDYFEDDGYSFEYLKGRYNQINISQIKTGDRIQAKISKNLTTYKFLDRSILFKFFSEDFFPSLIEVDGIKIKRCDDQSLLDPCWDKKEPKFFQVKIPEHTFEDDLVINIETKKLDRPKHSASFACNNIPNQSNMDIFILGSHPSLGAWQIDQAIKLEPTLTSSWSGFISDLEMKMPIEWKCLAIDRDLKSGIIWQSGPNNQLKEQLGNSAYLGIQSASF